MEYLNTHLLRLKNRQATVLLKLKTPHNSLFSASVIGRSQCFASLHSDEYGHLLVVTMYIYNQGKMLYTDQSHEVEFLLHLKKKQQVMPNNVETQHKHML